MDDSQDGTRGLDASPEDEPGWGWWDEQPPDEPEPEPAPKPSKPARFVDLVDFLNEPEPEYDWLIPGILERGDRLILTGAEGDGKSTLLRQIAIQAAAGVHPFTLEPHEPLRVTLMDFENGRRHLRRQLRTIWLAAGRRPGPGVLQVVTVPQGIDLQQEIHRDHLTGKLDLHHPDLIVAGPLYKMSAGDPLDEPPAKATAGWIDQTRTRYGAGIIVEAHQPYAASGAKRAERPYGASLWSRWPEFGLHLATNGELRHWRGDRDEREWPPILTRGGQWPWTAETDNRKITFARILGTIQDAGTPMSERDLASALGTNRMQIQRAIHANTKQYEAALETLAHTNGTHRRQGGSGPPALEGGI